ncbi:HNH endonuclease [Streptomyces sp. NPDC058864]
MRSPAWVWDELMLTCAAVVENGWRELRERDLRTSELSDLLRSLPLHGAAARHLPEFRSTGSISRKSTDLATHHKSYRGKPTRGGQLDKAVIAAFTERPDIMLAAAAALKSGIASGELHRLPPQTGETEDDGVTAAEGRLLVRRHLARERDPKLRRLKIEQTLRRGHLLACEVCSFHFASFYGTLGEGYIEVHHVVPLHASGTRETSLGDLALLCANCHRMCHRSRPGESWRSPEALRDEIKKVSGAHGQPAP